MSLKNSLDDEEHMHVFEVDGNHTQVLSEGEYLSAKTPGAPVKVYSIFMKASIWYAIAAILHFSLLASIAWNQLPTTSQGPIDGNSAPFNQDFFANYLSSSSGIFPLQWNSESPDDPLLVLGIPKQGIYDRESTEEQKPMLVIVDVIFGKGSIKEGLQSSLFHMPAIETDYNVFRFEYSPQGRTKVDLVRAIEYVRSTKSGESSTEEGAEWGGWTASLDVIHENECNGDAECEEYLYVDATKLLLNRFYVIASPPDYDPDQVVSDVRILKASSFPANINLELQVKLGYGTRATALDYVFGLAKLSDKPMVPRVANDRIGFFTTAFRSVGLNPGRGPASSRLDSTTRIINRRRLDTDNPTLVYYIDPSVPPVWRQYIKKGVENWKPAFEAAGFQNAIRAVLPSDDNFPKDYSAGDIRYSSISWAYDPDETFALGPATVDPRSGEIINADIVFTNGWVASWVQGVDFDSQESTDARRHGEEARSKHETKASRDARLRGGGCTHNRVFGEQQNNLPQTQFTEQIALFKEWVRLEFNPKSKDWSGSADRRLSGCNSDDMQLSEQFTQIVGQGLTDVTMHEVGHTLGLRHNFKGSAMPTVEQLRDPQYIAQNGLTSSVMDYLPINWWSRFAEAANPQHIPRNEDDELPAELVQYLFTPVVGKYDIAAIKYGYTPLSGPDADQVAEMVQCGYSPLEEGSSALKRIAKAAPDFGTDEDDSTSQGPDPFNSLFDLSSTPLAYYQDQLDLVQKLRRIANEKMEDLEIERHSDFDWFDYGYTERVLLRRVERAGLYAAKFVGGAYVRKEPMPVRVIPQQEQLAALDLVLDVVVGETKDGKLFPGSEPRFTEWGAKREGKCDGLQQYCYGVELLDWNQRTFEVQRSVLSNLLNQSRISRILQQEGVHSANRIEGDGVPFSLMEFLSSISQRIMSQDGFSMQNMWPVQRWYAKWLIERCDDEKEAISDLVADYGFQQSVLCTIGAQQIMKLDADLDNYLHKFVVGTDSSMGKVQATILRRITQSFLQDTKV